MKFLVIVLAIRYVFQLLNRISKKRPQEIDWSNPSEHNVWWWKIFRCRRRISFPVRCSGELTKPVRLTVKDITLSMWWYRFKSGTGYSYSSIPMGWILRLERRGCRFEPCLLYRPVGEKKRGYSRRNYFVRVEMGELVNTKITIIILEWSPRACSNCQVV